MASNAKTGKMGGKKEPGAAKRFCACGEEKKRVRLAGFGERGWKWICPKGDIS